MIFSFDDYRLDTDRLEFRRGDEPILLEPQVFHLLQHLIENRDRVVSKDELFEQVWQGRIVSDATLNSRINAARRAVGDNGKAQTVIRTVSKRGYRFVAELRIEPKASAGPGGGQDGQSPSMGPGHSGSKTSKPPGSPDHSLAVAEFEVDGDEKVEFLARGLRVYLQNGFSRHSTIEVVRESPTSRGRAEFVLEGSVRGRGGSVRLTFSLVERASTSQIWSERFDRRSEGLLELEEEIGRAVSAAVRVKLKDVEFERLKDSVDEDLSVADLLNKAAAYFVHGPGFNDVVEASLRTALAREPDNSMTVAMLSHSIWRGYEFTPLALPLPSKNEIAELAVRAVELNAESYFSHLIAAITAQDVLGDFERASRHAQAALDINPDLLGAHGMVGITKCHLGDPDAGIAMLQQILDTGREDPHRFRHQRELAIAHFVSGDLDRAIEVVDRLVQSEPQMDRNRPLQAALLWLRGDTDDAVAARRHLRDSYAGLSTLALRPIWIGRAGAAKQFNEALAAIEF